MRVWYPSLDSSPEGAPILSPAPGRYPLVVLLHGYCGQQADHYKDWFLLPAQLARSGYVVVVPRLPEIQSGTNPWDANADVALVDAMMTWVRTGWASGSEVMPPPYTAVVGHSYGALLGGRIVNAAPARFMAYGSIGGGWSAWPPSLKPIPIGALGVPAFFVWGDGDFFSDIVSFWPRIVAGGHDAHRAKLANGNHFDHLSATTPCNTFPGTCTSISALTADLTTIFLSKYMPPEHSVISPSDIPDSFVLPVKPLTAKQQFYVGGHMSGLSQLTAPGACAVTLTWNTSRGSGSRVQPTPAPLPLPSPP